MEHLRQQAWEMFDHGFRNYMTHAFPKDNLLPISCSGKDWQGGLAITLVDSLDALVLLNRRQDVADAVDLIRSHLRFDKDIKVHVFETVIRVLGGLLSGHMLLDRNPGLSGAVETEAGPEPPGADVAGAEEAHVQASAPLAPQVVVAEPSAWPTPRDGSQASLDLEPALSPPAPLSRREEQELHPAPPASAAPELYQAGDGAQQQQCDLDSEQRQGCERQQQYKQENGQYSGQQIEEQQEQQLSEQCEGGVDGDDDGGGEEDGGRPGRGGGGPTERGTEAEASQAAPGGDGLATGGGPPDRPETEASPDATAEGIMSVTVAATAFDPADGGLRAVVRAQSSEGSAAASDDGISTVPASPPGAAAAAKAPLYDGLFLRMAVELADLLLPAFNTPSGLPALFVHLKNGPVRDTHNSTCTACAGTLLLEFGLLTALTGNPVYLQRAEFAARHMYDRRSRLGLVGASLNVVNSEWASKESTIGPGSDSYYEYLLKAYLMFGKAEYLTMFAELYTSTMRWMQMPGTLQGYSFLVDVHMDNGRLARPFVSSLGAFWPGMQALAGQERDAINLHANFTAAWRAFGWLPEMFGIDLSKVHPEDPGYNLRPEHIESTYLLHCITQDPAYLRVAANIQSTLHVHNRVQCGFTNVNHVDTGEHGDLMESYFLSETAKYLYLMFSSAPGLIDYYVLSTEGHLIPPLPDPGGLDVEGLKRRQQRHGGGGEEGDAAGSGRGEGRGRGAGGGGGGTAAAAVRAAVDALFAAMEAAVEAVAGGHSPGAAPSPRPSQSAHEETGAQDQQQAGQQQQQPQPGPGSDTDVAAAAAMAVAAAAVGDAGSAAADASGAIDQQTTEAIHVADGGAAAGAALLDPSPDPSTATAGDQGSAAAASSSVGEGLKAAGNGDAGSGGGRSGGDGPGGTTAEHSGASGAGGGDAATSGSASTPGFGSGTGVGSGSVFPGELEVPQPIPANCLRVCTSPSEQEQAATEARLRAAFPLLPLRRSDAELIRHRRCVSCCVVSQRLAEQPPQDEAVRARIMRLPQQSIEEVVAPAQQESWPPNVLGQVVCTLKVARDGAFACNNVRPITDHDARHGVPYNAIILQLTAILEDLAAAAPPTTAAGAPPALGRKAGDANEDYDDPAAQQQGLMDTFILVVVRGGAGGEMSYVFEGMLGHFGDAPHDASPRCLQHLLAAPAAALAAGCDGHLMSPPDRLYDGPLAYGSRNTCPAYLQSPLLQRAAGMAAGALEVECGSRATGGAVGSNADRPSEAATMSQAQQGQLQQQQQQQGGPQPATAPAALRRRPGRPRRSQRGRWRRPPGAAAGVASAAAKAAEPTPEAAALLTAEGCQLQETPQQLHELPQDTAAAVAGLHESSGVNASGRGGVCGGGGRGGVCVAGAAAEGAAGTFASSASPQGAAPQEGVAAALGAAPGAPECDLDSDGSEAPCDEFVGCEGWGPEDAGTESWALDQEENGAQEENVEWKEGEVVPREDVLVAREEEESPPSGASGGMERQQDEEDQAAAADDSAAADMHAASDGGAAAATGPRPVLNVTSMEEDWASWAAGSHTLGPCAAGPPLTAPLVLSTPLDACSRPLNPADLAGAVAVVARGGCSFVTKVQHLQDAGAAAVLVLNLQHPTELLGMAPDDTGRRPDIPAVLLAGRDGRRLLRALRAAGGAALVASLAHMPPTTVSRAARTAMAASATAAEAAGGAAGGTCAAQPGGRGSGGGGAAAGPPSLSTRLDLLVPGGSHAFLAANVLSRGRTLQQLFESVLEDGRAVLLLQQLAQKNARAVMAQMEQWRHMMALQQAEKQRSAQMEQQQAP